MSASDHDAIQRLHHLDMQAAKNGDHQTLHTLWSDEPVMLPPDSPPIMGPAFEERFKTMQNAPPSPVEILDYVIDMREVEIVGDYAFEWGEIRGTTRHKETGETETSVYNVMRILQKNPDGDWKVHRAIWNDATPE